MPRAIEQRKRASEGVDGRDTKDYTDVDINVVARPTDPYSTPAQSHQLSDTMASLNNLGGVFIKQHELQRKANEVKATADHTKGEKKQPFNIFNLGVGYNETWDTVDGEVRGKHFRAEYNAALTENNNFMEDPNPEGKRNELYAELYAKNFDGVTSDYSFFGAQGHVENAKIEGEMQARDAVFKQRKGEFFSNIGELYQEELADAKTPTEMKAITDRYRELGMVEPTVTNDQISGFLIGQTFESMNEIANTDDSEMSYPERAKLINERRKLFTEKGAGGFSWDNLVDAEGKYKFRGDINTRLTGLDNEMKRQKADYIDKNTVAYSQDLAELKDTNVAGAKALWEQMKTDQYLSLSFRNTAGNALNQIIVNGGFPTQSIESTRRSLLEKAYRGTLTNGDLNNNTHSLSHADYGNLMGILYKPDPTGSSKKTPQEQFMTDVVDDGFKSLEQMGATDGEWIKMFKDPVEAKQRLILERSKAIFWLEDQRRQGKMDYGMDNAEAIQMYFMGRVETLTKEAKIQIAKGEEGKAPSRPVNELNAAKAAPVKKKLGSIDEAIDAVKQTK